jgi:hypothetical protein
VAQVGQASNIIGRRHTERSLCAIVRRTRVYPHSNNYGVLLTGWVEENLRGRCIVWGIEALLLLAEG